MTETVLLSSRNKANVTTHLEGLDFFAQELVGDLSVLVALKGHVPSVVDRRLARGNRRTVLALEQILQRQKRVLTGIGNN